jgi:cholesterol oxidase
MTPRVPSLAGPLPVDARGDVDAAVVVVGSGFGGAVAAVRLAERLGHDVLLVERGREVRPGEFPRTLREVVAELRGPAHPLGLLDVHIGRDLDAIVVSALGGGSQLYAGVTLPPDDALFATRDGTGRRVWPAAIDGASLRPHYATVRRMLAVEAWLDRTDAAKPGPATPDQLAAGSPVAADLADPAHATRRDAFGQSPAQRPRLRKSEPVREWATHSGAAVYRPPLAINLTLTGDGQPNSHGVPRWLCVQCGDCVTGCNFGAKNTLTTNYLPHAHRNGARLVPGVEVVGLCRGDRRRWRLDAVWRVAHGRRVDARRVRIHADTVVLAAGALGSTELLLRAGAAGLPLSSALGTRMSGNGDDWALSFDGRSDLNSAWRQGGERPGPTITLTADLTTPTGHNLVQDGGFPAAAMPNLGRALALATGRWSLALRRSRWQAAMNRSQVWLAMGNDDASGVADLHRGRLRIRWPDLVEQPSQRARAKALAELARLQVARLIRPPRGWARPSARTAVTVHALGGCPMADSVRHGVVDAAGRVYHPRGGVHPGLYVLDGAICPTSLGRNPSLGIAALAERALADILADTEVAA